MKLDKKIKILVKGPVLSMSGYGEQCRFALRALREKQNIYDIYLIPINWGKTGWISSVNEERQWIDSIIQKTMFYTQTDGKYDVTIQVTIPNEWEVIAPINIGYTAGIEANRISPEWVDKTNLMDKVIVVSEHSKYGFVNSIFTKTDNQTKEIVNSEFRCTTPVDVVNFCVRDTTVAGNHEIDQWVGHQEALDTSFNILEKPFKKDFNFLCVAQWSARKNIENTIKWFVEEFKDDENVGLVVKISEMNNSTLDKWRCYAKLVSLVEDIRAKYKIKCGLSLLHGEMTDSQMKRLYRHPQIKALINIAHGEGFGLPIFEAVSNALPVVAPAWSGQCDYLYAPVIKKNKVKMRPHFARVEYDLRQVQPAAVWKGVLEADSVWCFPKENSYKAKLREVYKDHSRFKSLAKKLQKHVLKTFTKENQYKKFVESVESVCGDANLREVEISDALIDEMHQQPPKLRAKMLKNIIKTLENQEDKLKLLKDKFKGEKCYVISCGPSLLDHDKESLRRLLADNLVIAVKQAYDVYSDVVDFHVYNCANFKNYEYYKHEPIILEASSLGRKLGHCDISFPIVERGFDNSLSKVKNFSDWTFDKKPLTRPYGPGIMYEMVLYLVEHLGVSEVITIGWDNKLRDDNKQHFYDIIDNDRDKYIHLNAVDDNSAAVANLPVEAKMTVDVMGDWYNWLKESGVEMKIISKDNEAPQYVPRLDLNEVLDFVEVL